MATNLKCFHFYVHAKDVVSNCDVEWTCMDKDGRQKVSLPCGRNYAWPNHFSFWNFLGKRHIGGHYERLFPPKAQSEIIITKRVLIIYLFNKFKGYYGHIPKEFQKRWNFEIITNSPSIANIVKYPKKLSIQQMNCTFCVHFDVQDFI